MTTLYIPHRNGDLQAILVDDDDALTVTSSVWRFDQPGRYLYRGIRRDGTRRYAFLHRIIMGIPVGDRRQVDHINGDTYDNRKQNLRIVPNSSAQSQNRRSAPNSSSRFRGVTLHKKTGKWQAQVTAGGRGHYLGLYSREEDAAQAASEFRRMVMPFSIEVAP